MFSTIWNLIVAKFAKQPESAVPVVPRSVLRPRQPPPRSILAHRTAELHLAQQQLQIEYKLVLERREEEAAGVQDLSEEQDILEEIKELSANFQQLRVTEEKGLLFSEVPAPEVPAQPSRRESTRLSIQIGREYQNEVTEFLSTKYSGEKADYACLTLEEYTQIRDYWKNKAKGHLEIKSTGFESVQKLTFRALGGLHFGEWLNDDVINIYLEMLEKQFLRDSGSRFRILNSYFATSTLQKSETQMQRVLKKKQLKAEHVLVMPVNNRNHWYFAVFEEGVLSIFDSLRQKENYYQSNPIFTGALKFAASFYGQTFRLSVRLDYPQQDNGYDCGVFMLLGIRDLLRRQSWSFRQGDIRFKRIQIAHQILREELVFSP